MEILQPSIEQERTATMLHALGNPLRMAIVAYIVEHPGCICNDLVVRFGRAQATISQHLAILRRAEIVDMERDGHASCYAANQRTIGWLCKELAKLQRHEGG